MTQIIGMMRTAVHFATLLAALTGSSFAQVTVDTASILVPSIKPTLSTMDVWNCYTANITQYADPPQATGTLDDALFSYAISVFEETCTLRGPEANDHCAFPTASRMCAFTTIAGPTPALAADFASYTSSVSAWWSSKGSDAVSWALSCPQLWWETLGKVPSSRFWLNQTMAYAVCNVQGGPVSAPAGPTTANPNGGAVPTTGKTGSATSTPTPTGGNRGIGRAEGREMWLVAGTGFAAAAANTVW